jgi:DNA-binding CsgD family transcriptional regulator
VRVVAAGEALLAPSVTRRLIEEFARRPVPGRQSSASLHELTPRELDVLRLLARGMSNAEIAKQLMVGESTVKTHVARRLFGSSSKSLRLVTRVRGVVMVPEETQMRPHESKPGSSPADLV